MSSREPDFWLRELARTGLPTADQQEVLASLSNAAETRARYFPSAPAPYLGRVRQFLATAFPPQKGPLFLSVDRSYLPERLSRSQCWQIVRLELSLLDRTCRPVDGRHIVISEVTEFITRNEFVLTVPPRWLVELFSVPERAAALKMETSRWSLRPSAPLGAEGQAFLEAILKNVEDDKRRSQRQHCPPLAGDTETLADSPGQPLLPPEEDPPIPPLPASLPLGHRPRLWIANPRADTPMRGRDDDATSMDSDLKGLDP